jgi:hypothetical protein
VVAVSPLTDRRALIGRIGAKAHQENRGEAWASWSYRSTES